MKLLEPELIQKSISKANTFFIELEFYGGDAVTYHREQEMLDGITALNYIKPENQTVIFKRIEFLELVKNVSTPEFCYDEIEAKYGEKVAKFIDNMPNDPECDFQFKCTFDDFELRYYDSESNLYSVYYKK